LLDQAYQRASPLSGGQQQRVAIARTLVQQPKLVLADEPIASLDPESARKVMGLLESINRDDGKTVIVSLHQVDYALRYCSRVVALRAGKLFFDGSTADVDRQFFRDLYGAGLDGEEHPESLLGTETANDALEKPTLAAATL
ncbi:MAG: ATP-binding cassette domain-containing protein, partial [Chromatiales bacterium]|nr:ATP-binding cassette domain-containing protein [Chromatiales bacterium]